MVHHGDISGELAPREFGVSTAQDSLAWALYSSQGDAEKAAPAQITDATKPEILRAYVERKAQSRLALGLGLYNDPRPRSGLTDDLYPYMRNSNRGTFLDAFKNGMTRLWEGSNFKAELHHQIDARLREIPSFGIPTYENMDADWEPIGGTLYHPDRQTVDDLATAGIQVVGLGDNHADLVHELLIAQVINAFAKNRQVIVLAEKKQAGTPIEVEKHIVTRHLIDANASEAEKARLRKQVQLYGWDNDALCAEQRDLYERQEPLERMASQDRSKEEQRQLDELNAQILQKSLQRQESLAQTLHDTLSRIKKSRATREEEPTASSSTSAGGASEQPVVVILAGMGHFDLSRDPVLKKALEAYQSLVLQPKSQLPLEIATEMYPRRAKALLDRCSNPKSIQEVNFWIEQAEYYRDQGRPKEAEMVYRGALKLSENAWGLEDRNTGFALTHLANFLRRQRKYEEALPLYRRALGIYETKSGPNHPDTAIARNNLDGLLRFLNRDPSVEPTGV